MPRLRTASSRDRFLSVLEQTRKRYRFVVLGYVIMPEHIHLLLSEPAVGTPSTVMQVLKQRTARALLPKCKPKDPRQTHLFGEAPLRAPVLAGPLLRLQRVDGAQAGRKTEVYAPQPGEAWIGGVPGKLAMEQLPLLCASGSGAGSRK